MAAGYFFVYSKIIYSINKVKRFILKIRKRNGSLEDFNDQKIYNAINAAWKSTKGLEEQPKERIKSLVMTIDPETYDTVEKIQDAVENGLMDIDKEVAKAYIRYRYLHQLEREGLKEMEEDQRYMHDYQTNGDNAAESSNTDPNANMTVKSIPNMEAEIPKKRNRRMQRFSMHGILEKLYDKDLADSYIDGLKHHIYYAHDEAASEAQKPYCYAPQMYPILYGTDSLDGTGTKAPDNLDSFCGQLINATFILASNCRGAVAWSEFFNFFDHFCVKEWGENYDLKKDKLVTTADCLKQRTVKDVIEQKFQQIVFNWNQPASNRGAQSPFINISYFDYGYWHALFDKFTFPDGSKPEWRRVDFLQRLFMKWFNKERTKTLLTFPVETMALLHNGEKVIDEKYEDLNAEMYSEGHSFFTYVSNNPGAIASCCFSPDTKVLWKSSTNGVSLTAFKDFKNIPYTGNKENCKFFHNGFWIKAKVIKTDNTNFYKVTTANKKVYYMTDNHINVTFDCEKPTKELTTDDYLMFNTNRLDAVNEVDEHLTYAEGFAVGAFLGNGSFGKRFEGGRISEINFSQGENNYSECMNFVRQATIDLGSPANVTLESVYNHVYPVRLSSEVLVRFIQKWTSWTEGTKAPTKKLNLDCILQSVDFRKGILAGWYNTDGGNSNRCYTTSSDLKDGMEVLITSLGMSSIIDCSDRTDEKVVIREQEFNRNYPLWCVRWYAAGNKSSMKDVYKYKNNSIYFKVTSIEKVTLDVKNSYCLECKDKKNPYFTLPSGLITHNCRLRSELPFNFTTGLTGVETGSCNVITMNLNRITQDWIRSYYHTKGFDTDSIVPGEMKGIMDKQEARDSFVEYISGIVKRIHKYHIGFKTLLYDEEKRKMFPPCNAGYIHFNKLYSTVGINGINEAAEYLGMKCRDNDDYRDFCRLITGTISKLNKEDSTPKFMFNTEFVPAESLGSKNYKWDKKDGYWVPKDRNLYNSYFYIASDPNTSVVEKFRLHGKAFTGLCDGGVGLHVNLEDHLSKEQYRKLLRYAIKVGCTYFTYNIPNCQCDKCGYIEKRHFDVCPKCGSKETTDWTRIIG